MAEPDLRLFRIHYTRGPVKFGYRHVLGPAVAYSKRHGGYSYNKGRIYAIFATNAEATDGWTDVTEEFLSPRD